METLKGIWEFLLSRVENHPAASLGIIIALVLIVVLT